MKTYTADPLVSSRAIEMRHQMPKLVDVQQGLRELLSSQEFEVLQRVVEG